VQARAHKLSDDHTQLVLLQTHPFSPKLLLEGDPLVGEADWHALHAKQNKTQANQPRTREPRIEGLQLALQVHHQKGIPARKTTMHWKMVHVWIA
jgi:hypothetical protein